MSESERGLFWQGLCGDISWRAEEAAKGLEYPAYFSNSATPKQVIQMAINSAVSKSEEETKQSSSERDALAEQVRTLTEHRQLLRDEAESEGRIAISHGFTGTDDGTPCFFLSETVKEQHATIAQLQRELAEVRRWLKAYDESDQLCSEPELRKALVESTASLATAEAQVAALQADKERLDWLERTDCTSFRMATESLPTNIRSSIDAARTAPTQEGAQ